MALVLVRMKVCLLGPAYPYRGGIAAFNDRLAIEFMDCGDEVNIENFSLQYPEFLFPGKTQYNPSDAPSSVRMERSVNSVNPFNWIKVGLKIRKQAPDLLIVRYWLPFMAPCLGTIMRIVRGNNHTRVVALVDNIIPHERHFYDTILSKYFVGAAHRFVVMSVSVGKELRGFTSKPIGFNPHPLYDIYGEKVSKAEALQHLGLDSNLRYMMFFGFIRDYKGLDLLLEAYAAGKYWDRGVKLIVAGEFYGNSDKYFFLADSLGVRDKIVWHNDFIADNEVRYWFASADVVVQPYKTATQSGITQIAYHFERPMIVTNVGGLAEIVPDGKVGYVVEPDAKLLELSIDKFFSASADAVNNVFSDGIIEEKRRYSWASMVECLKDDKNIEK